MDTIYSAANSASRALFGETATDASGRPIENQSQSQNQNRTGPSSIIDHSSSTDTNPFRGASDTDTNNPFRHATDSASYSSGGALGGSGTQHSAGSAIDGVHLNKQPPGSFEHGYGSAASTPGDGGLGSLDSARHYDKPISAEFTHPSDSDSKPTTATTTNVFAKPPVGDLNKDGSRHDTSVVRGPDFSAARPTISDVTSDTTTTARGPSTCEHDQMRSKHDVSDPLGASNRQSSNVSQGVMHGGGGFMPSEAAEVVGSDLANQEQDRSNSGGVRHGGGGFMPSEAAEVVGSDVKNQEQDRSNSGGVRHGGGGFMPSEAAGVLGSGMKNQEQDRSNSGGVRHGGGGFMPSEAAGVVGSDLSQEQDSSNSGNVRHGGGGFMPSEAARVVGSDMKNQEQDSSNSRDTNRTTNPTDTSTGAFSTNPSAPTPAANAPKSLINAAGSGPGAVASDAAADPSSAQQPTPKQQGADRPQESPDAHKPQTAAQTEEQKKSAGTGEKYEKSTGMAAEGGDFDASRPGAGREADRLLDEKGIHHGKEAAPNTAQITAPHSKLLPHKKEKELKEHEHGAAPAKHETAATDHHDANTAEQSPGATAEDGSGSDHKGLGTKIKEKLHLGHH